YHAIKNMANDIEGRVKDRFTVKPRNTERDTEALAKVLMRAVMCRVSAAVPRLDFNVPGCPEAGVLQTESVPSHLGRLRLVQLVVSLEYCHRPLFQGFCEADPEKLKENRTWQSSRDTTVHFRHHKPSAHPVALLRYVPSPRLFPITF